MLKSMTGYGKYETIFDSIKVCCEIKSLNSKQIDINLKLPSEFKEFDLDCRKWLSSAIVRGKVDVAVTLDKISYSKSKITIDANTIGEYYEMIKEIAAQKNIPEPNSGEWFRLLLKLPDVLVSKDSEISDLTYNNILSVIKETFFSFESFRIEEGRVLKKFLLDRIEKIDSLLDNVEKHEKERIRKISDRIENDFKQIEAKIDLDPNRLAQEMIFYLEKLDISEEKARLKSHINYFLQIVDKEENQGKKLGFVVQEMGREINTLGSKANNSDMQQIVVMMKDELEQIKEQILNVL